MEYITVKNGVITGHFCGESVPEGAIRVPTGFSGWEGLPVAALTDDYLAIKPITQLISEGLISIPEGYKVNQAGTELIRMAQYEIDTVFPPEIWAIVGSYEAITVHKAFDAQGNFGYHAPDTAIKMQDAQPSNSYKAQSDGTWVFDKDVAKTIKLTEINTAYNIATSALVNTYPQTELLTFDKQEKEARAWDADNTIATPFLDGLASARGIDKAELVRRVIAKADAFQTVVATLTGLRQKYEDQLNLAQTEEEIAAITPTYNESKNLFDTDILSIISPYLGK